MATAKISALPLPTTPLAGSELLEMVQGGVSKQVEASYVAASFATDPANVLPLTAGGTGATSAAAARTSLGATTVGASLFTLANPTAITFPRINADNSVSALTAADFRTATSSAVSGANNDITSLTGLTTPLSVPQGGTGATALTGYVKGTGTTAMTASSTIPVADLTGTLPVANGGTGAVTLTGYVKGAGTAAMTATATIPYDDLAGRAWINASSTLDQVGSTTTATAFTMNTGTTGTGITVNASTQITFAAAGTYMLTPSVQFKNTDTNDRTVTVWFRKNGVDIANSASTIDVPKAADGGVTVFTVCIIEAVTAGQYIEVMWLVSNTTVTADATAAAAGPPAIPAVPSIIVPAVRIA
jgi:hypothetical protein